MNKALRYSLLSLIGIGFIILSLNAFGVPSTRANAGWDNRQDRAQFESISSQVSETTEFVCTYYFGFNTAKEPFTKLLVRKAFSAAIDRVALAPVLGSDDLPAMTFTPPGVFGHVDGFSEGVGIPYNPTQAQEWLANAGYPNGQGLPQVELVFPASMDDDRYNFTGQIAQSQWSANLNVDVTLKVMEISSFLLLLQQNPPQIWHYRWCTDQPEQVEASEYLSVAIDTRRVALGNWQNSSYDNFLTQAAGTADPNLRKSLYKQAEEILVETDAVIFPLNYIGAVSTVRGKIYLPVILFGP